jgi:aminopeptidase N
MKKIIHFFFVLSVPFCFSQTTELEFEKMVESESKSAASTMNVQVNPNTQNYDITYHELRFTVNPNNTPAAISGIVKTTFTALANMNTITFDMATQLVVSSVTMNSVNLNYSQSNYELNIIFPSTISSGTSASVIITYAGIPPTAEGAFTRGTHAGTPVIYTLSEPFGARDWWPCKQDLNDKINSFDIYITAPSAFYSVSNGLEQ